MKSKVVDVLKKGGTAVLLTDTLYGIVGQALNKKTVERIYKIKKRNKTKPLIILISSVQDLELFGVEIDQKLKAKLAKFWPGPNSLILPCGAANYYLHRGKKCLAFRLPKKKSLVSLIKKTGPLVAPSANPEGLPPAENIKMAKDYFGDQIDYYVNGGRPRVQASNIIKINKKGELEVIR